MAIPCSDETKVTDSHVMCPTHGLQPAVTRGSYAGVACGKCYVANGAAIVATLEREVVRRLQEE